MTFQYYKNGDGYLCTANISPRPYVGVVVLVWTGKTPTEVVETAMTPKQLSELEEVDTVPEDWWLAFSRIYPKLPRLPALQPKPTILVENPPAKVAEPQEPKTWWEIIKRALR